MAIWVVDKNHASHTNIGAGRRTKGSPNIAMGINCYIMNLNTGMKVNFITTPQTITESLSANFGQQTIPGRSDPLFYYTNSGPRNVTFTMTIVDDYTPYGIVYTVNQLKAMVYPHYVGMTIHPPRCYLSIGRFLTLTGFLQNIEVTWQSTPIREQIYQYADVAFTFTQAVQVPYSDVQVEQGATSS